MKNINFVIWVLALLAGIVIGFAVADGIPGPTPCLPDQVRDPRTCNCVQK